MIERKPDLRETCVLDTRNISDAILRKAITIQPIQEIPAATSQKMLYLISSIAQQQRHFHGSFQTICSAVAKIGCQIFVHSIALADEYIIQRLADQIIIGFPRSAKAILKSKTKSHALSDRIGAITGVLVKSSGRVEIPAFVIQDITRIVEEFVER